ncbi:bifunctional biotin--[acetyl-CoA-carboxylase] ligase/biotin operon repressor BirA [Haliea sp. E1-2-M8]|uniref:bifunctional biotin--[acetyl-CoA-carboxylase] ligase/biotin operon repressor BirA n=1 Tax=Haliea sp. E1-2-M8 TaxID=3064706 RepID=UPI002727247A|nr:bifunctional biotin--[acetyl-CoA-carboxylase] ligase/biotin operon repressor BirA [Haliea sp. E1-2-M8]MDO8863386.1 bifunctional biotin--[acetyl-CoA-carboxylase] ligase/biotin operon repressor BirA [Haliea sp. E1-2-M8]
MPKTTLIPMLADGEFHSGQDLAAALGVSRTAVWKQLNRLEELGLAVESVKGRGYRIPGGVELLDELTVRAGLDSPVLGLLRELQLLETVDSTNAEALRRVAAGSGAGLVCSAEQQTAGRGRRGRAWVSPYARNIYLSLVWEYNEGAAALEGLSLAVGVAVTRALAHLGLPPLQLKWPNDLLFAGAKVGGVLLEMAGDASGRCQVVIGVGINVAMPPAAAQAIDQAWTDLATVAGGQAPGRNAVVASLLNELLPLAASFARTGFAPWRDSWMALDAFADASVVLHSGEQRQAGVARGVDERGALQLETTLGLRPIYGGEISLRAAP